MTRREMKAYLKMLSFKPFNGQIDVYVLVFKSIKNNANRVYVFMHKKRVRIRIVFNPEKHKYAEVKEVSTGYKQGYRFLIKYLHNLKR